MGGFPIDTINRLIQTGKLPAEAREMWEKVWCKGGCRDRTICLVVPANGIIGASLVGGIVIHEGAGAFHKYLCLSCGREWLSNTRPRGGKGAWDDENDPSIKQGMKNPPLRRGERF